jgi:hypothetical protein
MSIQQSQQQPNRRQSRTWSSFGVPALVGQYSNNIMDKLNCLCASENQVSDEVEDFDDISRYHERKQRLYLEDFMASHHFDGFEQGDESTNSIHRKDTMPMMQNTSLESYESSEEKNEEMRQKAPQGNRGLKRVNSMNSQTSSADTCTTVSLSQSFMYDDEDNEDDDEVCSTVTTEAAKNLQTPFRSKGRTDSNNEHEAYGFLLRMQPDNYIRED